VYALESMLSGLRCSQEHNFGGDMNNIDKIFKDRLNRVYNDTLVYFYCYLDYTDDDIFEIRLEFSLTDNPINRCYLSVRDYSSTSIVI
jgi:hypothetical protein